MNRHLSVCAILVVCAGLGIAAGGDEEPPTTWRLLVKYDFEAGRISKWTTVDQEHHRPVTTLECGVEAGLAHSGQYCLRGKKLAASAYVSAEGGSAGSENATGRRQLRLRLFLKTRGFAPEDQFKLRVLEWRREGDKNTPRWLMNREDQLTVPAPETWQELTAVGEVAANARGFTLFVVSPTNPQGVFWVDDVSAELAEIP